MDRIGLQIELVKSLWVHECLKSILEQKRALTRVVVAYEKLTIRIPFSQVKMSTTYARSGAHFRSLGFERF